MNWRRCQWNPIAEKALNRLIDPAVKSELLREIEEGKACLWCIESDDRETWLVTRVDFFPDGSRELVLEVVQGRNVNAVIDTLKARCIKLGIESIRFETHHSEKAASRLIRGSGFERAASIFRCAL